MASVPEIPVPQSMASLPGLLAEIRKEQLDSLPAPPDSLYHYTDTHGLMGIFRSSELWATDALYTNDSFEIVHALFILGQHVQSRKKDPANDPLTAMMTIAGQEFYAVVNTYVVSFCSDGDLLSQWRGYAHPGGYSLGFDPDVLTSLCGPHVMLAPVVYNRAEQESKIADLVKRWDDVFGAADPNDFNEQVIRLGAFSFAQTLSFMAALFKNEGFKEEQEWRLVYRRQGLLHEAKPLGIGHRERMGMVAGYARLPLPAVTEKSVPIRNVIVGPADNPNLAMIGVHQFQKSLGYPEELIRVGRSVISLR